jgi:hypothetical protein
MNEVLKWASSGPARYRTQACDQRQNGCPWDKDRCLKHAQKKEIREWIKSN